jgi:site-specific recombinase XerD
LFAYAALLHPEHAALIQRVLSIPSKRFEKPTITFLTAEQIDALVNAPDLARWQGRGDRALLLTAVQTGLRVAELTGLNCADLTLGTGAAVSCLGKGRRHRAVPLTAPTEAVLKVWVAERTGRPDDPLFPHPHVLRHSCAMTLLQAGVDTAVIALWLGHADIRSTHTYLHADMTIKQRALDRTTPASSPPGRYRPTDSLLAFLEAL